MESRFTCSNTSLSSPCLCHRSVPTLQKDMCGHGLRLRPLQLQTWHHAKPGHGVAQNCAAVPYVNTMKKDEDAAVSVREAVAGLWRKGAALTWDVPAGPVAGGASHQDLLSVVPVARKPDSARVPCAS